MSKKSEKFPALQFYVGDWRKDPGVQALTYHDRGVWFEILCLMFESEDRGKLLLNGKPMSDEALSRLLGLDKQVLIRTLTTLLDFGVASRDENGALFSRRMVKDEHLRQVRQEAGKLGGNPNLINKSEDLVNQNPNQTPTTQVNQNPTPSGSLSVSTTNTKKEPNPARAREPSANVKKLIPEEERRIEIQSALDWIMQQKQIETALYYEKDWIHLLTLLGREGISLEEFREFYLWLEPQDWVDFIEPPLMRQQIEAWKKRRKIEAKKLKAGVVNGNNGTGKTGGKGGAQTSAAGAAAVSTPKHLVGDSIPD